MMAGFDSFFLTTLSVTFFEFSKVAHRFPYDSIAGVTETSDMTIVFHLRSGQDFAVKKLPNVERFALKAALETFPAMGPNSQSWVAWQEKRKDLVNAHIPTQKEVVRSERATEVAPLQGTPDATAAVQVEPEVTDQAKVFNGKRALAKRTALLQPGEVPFFIGHTPGLTAGFDTFFLTTLGVTLFASSTVAHRFPYDFVAGVTELADKSLVMYLQDGREFPIKKLPNVERFALRAALETFPVSGSDQQSWIAWQERRKQLADSYVPTQKEVVKAARATEVATRQEQAQVEQAHQRSLRERAATKTWPNTRLPNGPPNKAGGLSILQHCHDGEEPWFILTSFGAGCIACFDDRLMVVKAGNGQGFMAGTLFGSRSTTFYYSDINAIEFNKQVLGSVLEVLTSSYQGTSNHDYWRGSTRGRNTNSGDPWTLSNTLPITNTEYTAARAEMSELRRRIAAAKQTTVNVSIPAAYPPAPAGSPSPDDLVSKLARLAELKDAGVLSDEEFAAAKARLLSGSGM
jgi:hypothetical protein